MALYEVTLTTVFQGEQCINRWNYVSIGTPAVVTGSFALVSAMLGANAQPADPTNASLIYAIMQLVSNQVQFVGLTAKAIYDVIDFYERPFVPRLNGLVQGEALPPFAAFGFRTSRVRQDISRATKRFVGVAEGLQTSGTIIPLDPDYLTALANRMSETLVYDDEGNSVSFTPAVVKKERYETPQGTFAYRYYADQATQMSNVATGILWEAYPTIRSQTSRQFGRGQ